MRLIQIMAAIVLVALAGAVGWHQYKLANPTTAPLPAIALDALDGEPGFDLTALNGAGLLNVFASDCIDCRSEMPLLLALQAEGVTIYGISTDTSPDQTMSFLAEVGNPYAGLMQAERSAISEAFGEVSLPYTLILSNDGEVLAYIEGPVTVNVLRNQIYPMLDRQAQLAR